MLEKVSQLQAEVDAFKATSLEEVEQFRIRFLGRGGEMNTLFSAFKSVEPEGRKAFGGALNLLKKSAADKVGMLKKNLADAASASGFEGDLTQSVVPELGARHPLSLVRNEIVGIFARRGFVISEGPEVEDDWHNFSALNFPQEHPARDMQDTFFVQRGEEEIALRTHTSSVQVRIMENNQPPIRTISPGRVFRNEAISARAHCFFHQVEGLYVGQDASFADLKQTLFYFAQELFGAGTKIRFRPSYFPFTEPSAEMDISCNICKQAGCSVCKNTGWVEILGCGMVDPSVLDNCGIDSKKHSGYAFGMGVERITMLKYGIKDLRLFFENDTRFLKQFQSTIQ